MLADEILIQRAQQGDMSAFEKLIERYDNKVLSMALSYTRDPEDAKDVYQEVFIRVFRALPKFQQRSLFSTWVHRIVINVCKTHQSRSARHAHVSLDETLGPESPERQMLQEQLSDGSSGERMALRSDLESQMNQALQLLSPKQRLVFTLRHYDGYKLREIAAMMSCAEGTVKRHLFSATRRVREVLRPLAAEGWQG